MKRVRITLEMDSQFIKFLNVYCQLKEIGPYARHLDQPQHRLAATSLVSLVLAEARGATTEQVDQMVHDDWVGQLRAIHEERKVEEIPA